MINDSVAQRWWPGGDALGDRLTIGRFQGKVLMQDVSRQVVGLLHGAAVAAARQSAIATMVLSAAASPLKSRM